MAQVLTKSAKNLGWYPSPNLGNGEVETFRTEETNGCEDGVTRMVPADPVQAMHKKKRPARAGRFFSAKSDA